MPIAALHLITAAGVVFALLAPLHDQRLADARASAGMVGLALGRSGSPARSTLLSESADHSGLSPAWAIFAGLLSGSVLFTWGLLRWRGRWALGLRVAGCVVMALALAPPALTTFALPLLALLALTLRPTAELADSRGRVASPAA